MLIRLTSSTSGELVMFATNARRLFEIMGKERTARGVFTLEQLPAALGSLCQAVDEEKLAASLRAAEERSGKAADHAEPADAEGEDADHEVAVQRRAEAQIGLGQRARPLINLMEWTVKEKGYILWEAEHDF